jgi:nucleoside-diphosphate-sugar epimerase
VLHLAPLGAARREPLAALDAATRGTFVLLNAALDAGVPRAILGSSLDLFDRLPAHWDVTERWRPRPAGLMREGGGAVG